MVVYATAEDLADFLVIVPVWPGAERHLQQASEDIDDLLIGAVYDVDADQMPTDPKVRDAVKRATYTQAPFIQTSGDETGPKVGFASVNVGGTGYSRAARPTTASAVQRRSSGPCCADPARRGLLPTQPRTRTG
ncbi:hypothetical protein [Actinomadura nitritigenes]|uniref:hypothetical protein n=1 Tax=Actinomadura nitritigenes TaxID=134602 RepID=UPI003D8E920D